MAKPLVQSERADGPRDRYVRIGFYEAHLCLDRNNSNATTQGLLVDTIGRRRFLAAPPWRASSRSSILTP